jgi:hypothetical protein
MVRNIVLVLALLLIGGFAFLTVSVAVDAGVTPLVVLSFIVLLVLGFGVLGALTGPPDDR